MRVPDNLGMKAFRPVRMLGSVLALLAGLFWLERAWEVWDAKGEPLARYGNSLTGYGLGVFAEILLRMVFGAVLLWLFAKLAVRSCCDFLSSPAQTEFGLGTLLNGSLRGASRSGLDQRESVVCRIRRLAR
jgi:hypothetical protein